MPVISVIDNYKSFYSQLKQLNTQPSACAMDYNSKLASTAPPHSISFTDDGIMPVTSSASANVSPQTEDVNADLYAGADLQLLEYAMEPSTTWEDLKTRPPLFGGEEQGHWRFASAEDICRSRRLPG